MKSSAKIINEIALSTGFNNLNKMDELRLNSTSDIIKSVTLTDKLINGKILVILDSMDSDMSQVDINTYIYTKDKHLLYKLSNGSIEQLI